MMHMTSSYVEEIANQLTRLSEQFKLIDKACDRMSRAVASHMRLIDGTPSLSDLVRLWFEQENLPYVVNDGNVIHKAKYDAGESMWPVGAIEDNESKDDPRPHIWFFLSFERVLAVDPLLFDKLRSKLI